MDFVLAVGGGSTIDSAKAIAAGAVYDGDFWDFFSGKGIEKALPVGTILTIAAAGSEGSPHRSGRRCQSCRPDGPGTFPEGRHQADRPGTEAAEKRSLRCRAGAGRMI